MKIMITDLHGFWNLIRQSARFLIVLVCFASAQATSLQESVIKEGCSKYQDPKSLGTLKKFVEPAMEKGCVACHLDCDKLSPADQKEPPAFYLKAKEPALCMECHASLGKDLLPAHDHQPLDKSKCSGCHDPHSSDTPKLLLSFSHGPYAARLCSACHPAPTEGKVGLTAANVDALCYKCHTNFKAEMAATGSRHKLLSQSNRSCMECHDPHAANQEYDLKKPVQELCVGCHNEKPEKPSQVEVISLEGDSAERQYLKLSSKFVHEPAKKSCLICHEAHTSELPKELRVPVRDLCMDCHGPNSEKIVQSSQPFPLFNGLVSLPPKSFEKLSRFELPGKYVHEPVNVSCALCHDAHASDNAAGLYAPVTELCIACHGPNGRTILRSKQPVPLFGGKVTVPPKSFEKLATLDIIKGRFGHPTADHPIFVAATKEKAELNCSSCHSSHSNSIGPKLLITDKKEICQKCHEF